MCIQEVQEYPLEITGFVFIHLLHTGNKVSLSEKGFDLINKLLRSTSSFQSGLIL